MLKYEKTNLLKWRKNRYIVMLKWKQIDESISEITA